MKILAIKCAGNEKINSRTDYNGRKTGQRVFFGGYVANSEDNGESFTAGKNKAIIVGLSSIILALIAGFCWFRFTKGKSNKR